MKIEGERKMGTQEQTAKQIWDYLTSKGWTKEAVSAILGNMQSESGIIADRWESDIVGNMYGGYGLVQWTPATKYIDWAVGNGLDYRNVISQCKRIEWEVANGQQFYHPSMTFKQFTQSKQSPETLAEIFIRYYERPANPNQPARQTQARYWYNKFKNSSTEGKTPQEIHDEAIASSAIKTSNGVQAKIEIFKEQPVGNITAGGWMGPGYNYGFVLVLDHNTGKELDRRMSPGIVRDDVNAHLGLPSGLKYGIQGVFPKAQFKGKVIDVVFRRTNDKSGNTAGGYQDFRFNEFYLTI